MRIIAATHQNLEELVSANRFREDLFHRLNVIRIHIPRLRDRVEDIPALSEHFLREAAHELGEEPKVLTRETMQILTRLEWPGNVRQLENTCRWITVMATGREVLPEDLPPELVARKAQRTDDQDWDQALRTWAERELSASAGESEGLLDKAVPIFERVMIATALTHSGGRKKDAAALLGWGRNTLTRKIKELGMTEHMAHDPD